MEFFLGNKCKTAAKPTIHQDSAASKPFFEKFVPHRYRLLGQNT